MEKLMTVDDVAEYLRLNREVVLRKARKGEIPAVKVGTKTYRFYKEQVDEWLKSKSVTKVGRKVKELESRSYSLEVKGHVSRREFSPVIEETNIGAEIMGGATTSDKERQLAVLAEARKLQAEMASRLGKPLPNSAEDIRALREERARHAS